MELNQLHSKMIKKKDKDEPLENGTRRHSMDAQDIDNYESGKFNGNETIDLEAHRKLW